jgi:energy-converting hydrogenase Eha subunit B
VAAVLVFVAAKMIGEPLLGFHLGSLVSTAIIVSFLAASMLAGPVLAFFRGNQK